MLLGKVGTEEPQPSGEKILLIGGGCLLILLLPVARNLYSVWHLSRSYRPRSHASAGGGRSATGAPEAQFGYF
jgi:hypothetical protein